MPARSEYNLLIDRAQMLNKFTPTNLIGIAGVIITAVGLLQTYRSLRNYTTWQQLGTAVAIFAVGFIVLEQLYLRSQRNKENAAKNTEQTDEPPETENSQIGI